MQENAARAAGGGRLAPIAFVAGLVLLGLSLLAFALAATASDASRVEYSESWVVNDTVTLAYPIDAGHDRGDRLTVDFRFPHENGTAMALRCADVAAVRRGEPPASPEMVVDGPTGRFSLAIAPALAFGAPLPPAPPGSLFAPCPFLYIVFQWPAQDGAEAGRPAVEIARDPVLLAGPAGALAALSGVVGALLASTGGILWGRRLNRERAPPPAHEDESAAETLFLALERSAAWLDRTRRYVLLAGVLGLFLWYPILLPWAWNIAIQGTRASPQPWLVAGGVLALLLTLTALWAREYLRLDRELVGWRERIARLREREAALMETFGEAR